ncbi:MAG: NUDIX hydrolase [Cellulomonadaceae bacterium]|jgi:8-oxo-dGTP diphosphatase|nr:NUDIX hydrolase [Cellulomonadaceae bacterium]
MSTRTKVTSLNAAKSANKAAIKAAIRLGQIPEHPSVAGQSRRGHHKPVRTAGALVWRVNDGALQVQLVHRPRYDDWSWPKGKLEPGESLQTAATREVGEETGKPVVLGIPLPGTRYRLSNGQWKTVAYWAARRADHSTDLGALVARGYVPPASPDEIDRVRWFDVDAAADRLTRRSDLKPLNALVEAYEAGRLDTNVLIIARHGKATPRAAWHEDDDADRPLTPIGHAHAAAMVPVLSAYGVGRVVSSRWERCAATLESYVRATGLRPWFSNNLTESAHARNPDRAAATTRELLESETNAVMCTHRPVLPTVLRIFAEQCRRSIVDLIPPADPFLEPGELLVAHVTPAVKSKGPRIVAIEHVAPAVY